MENTGGENNPGFVDLLERFNENGNYLKAFSANLNEINDEKLSLVKKALCLGAGPGKYETASIVFLLKYLDENFNTFIERQKLEFSMRLTC